MKSLETPISRQSRTDLPNMVNTPGNGKKRQERINMDQHGKRRHDMATWQAFIPGFYQYKTPQFGSLNGLTSIYAMYVCKSLYNYICMYAVIYMICAKEHHSHKSIMDFSRSMSHVPLPSGCMRSCVNLISSSRRMWLVQIRCHPWEIPPIYIYIYMCVCVYIYINIYTHELYMDIYINGTQLENISYT